MNLAVRPVRVLASVDRRMLAAIQVVDAITQSPVHLRSTADPGASLPGLRSAGIRVLGAELERDAGNVAVAVSENAVRFRRNRSGMFVLLRAPFFDVYASTFQNPTPPSETADGPLRLHLAVDTSGSHYLPQSFSIALPRSLVVERDDAVYKPVLVSLLRAPSTSVQHGWSVARVRVTRTDSDPAEPLPGVLIRVFRRPRAAGDLPIGLGMTDWRGRVRGEAVVPIHGIPRFRPGSGNGDSVLETTVPVVLEAARLVAFDGGGDAYPDVRRMLAAIPDNLTEDPGAALSLVREAALLDAKAGREETVPLSMP